MRTYSDSRKFLPDATDNIFYGNYFPATISATLTTITFALKTEHRNVHSDEYQLSGVTRSSIFMYDLPPAKLSTELVVLVITDRAGARSSAGGVWNKIFHTLNYDHRTPLFHFFPPGSIEIFVPTSKPETFTPG